MANSIYRGIAAGHNVHPDKDRGRLIEHLARAMHETVCGSWEAAGFDVKYGFIRAADHAVAVLADEGWDIFAYPDGGWSAVNADGNFWAGPWPADAREQSQDKSRPEGRLP